MGPKGGVRRRSDAGVHERPAADSAACCRASASRRTKSTWAAVKGFPRERRAGSRRHLCLERHRRASTSVPDSRGVTINVHYSISAAAADRLPAAPGRRPRRLLPDGRQGLLAARATTTASSATSIAGTCRRPTRRPRCRRRRSRSCSGSKRRFRSIPQADPRRHLGMEQGLREGRLRQRDRSPPAAGQRRLGSGRHQLQHVPLDHRRAPASRWARRA